MLGKALLFILSEPVVLQIAVIIYKKIHRKKRTKGFNKIINSAIMKYLSAALRIFTD